MNNLRIFMLLYVCIYDCNFLIISKCTSCKGTNSDNSSNNSSTKTQIPIKPPLKHLIPQDQVQVTESITNNAKPIELNKTNKIKLHFDSSLTNKFNQDNGIDISGIKLDFNGKEKDFYFEGYLDEIKVNFFNITCTLIKNLIKKKGLSNGIYNIKKLKVEHTGKNPILKVNVKKDPTSFNLYIKKDKNTNRVETTNMLKCFEIVGLLPYIYTIDQDNLIIVSEDVKEKGYNFLEHYTEENEYNTIKHKHLQILKSLQNINEFRFWCYIFQCDDIDPFFKYDNFCYKDQKAFPLDLRYSPFVTCYESDDDYINFLRKAFRKINTNDTKTIDENSLGYKIYISSLNEFKGFNKDEITRINNKLPDILEYINFNINKANCSKYMIMLLKNICDIFYAYLKNKLKGGKIQFTYNGESITMEKIIEKKQKFEITNDYLEELNSQFFEKLKLFGDNYFISNENLLLIFELYIKNHIIPYDPFYHGISGNDCLEGIFI